MPAPLIVVIEFTIALIGYSLVAKWYVVPALAGRPLSSSLPPLILPHLIRPVSLWLLAPGVIVQPSLPRVFATGTAYGDLVATALALVAILLARSGHRMAVAAAWLFNVVGLLDALRNCAVGIMTKAPFHMGAGVLIPAFGVPLLLVSHVLVFKVLIDHARGRTLSSPRADAPR
jgi:hypothetical protein